MYRWLFWVLAACHASSGTSEPAIPRLDCASCDLREPPLSTYSTVELEASWQGRCWESNGECGGPLPTPGTPSECKERSFRCKAVDHELVIRCDNDACRASPPRTRADAPGIRYSELVLTRPGFSWITATFDPDRGKSRTERIQVDVRRPDRAHARCAGTEVEIVLFEGEVELRGTHTSLQVTMPDGTSCHRTVGHGRYPNVYRCPSASPTLRVTAPDFTAEVTVECS